MSRPKDIGTRAESAVVRAFPAEARAERRALAGAADQGDVWAYAGRAVLEVKSRGRAHSHREVERWLCELDHEWAHAQRAGAPVDFAGLVVKVPGVGPDRCRAWPCYMRPSDAAWLLAGVQTADADDWVSMPLGVVLDRLHNRLRGSM